MLADLLPLLAALGLAAWLYYLREARRRRERVNPLMPEITAQEAWNFWRQHPEGHPDREFIPGWAAESPTPGDLNEIDSRSDLRREILAAAAQALHLECLEALGEPERQLLLRGYQPGMSGLLHDALVAATLRWIVLRQYGRLKYDDAVPEDWFHHFLRVATPYVHEKIRLAREHVLEIDASAGRLVEIYDALIAGLVKELLGTPPKRRFVPP